ncbi:unnamed protein product [Thelazia callipaeda]|uniref:DRBM domain-containing protein n=1 Tax=Thelazia callipaeda TaxID=103827 RepID=A0A158RC24_THECL|nr:unnamed protein product [Thelazia callipaeda]
MKGSGSELTKSCSSTVDPIFQPQIWCGQHLSGQETPPTKYVYNYSQLDEYHQRTPMCRIAELARYNKIKHEYKLMDESGPAHRKQFTVSLVLTPDQIFYGKGASIKKAQQSAAESALNETNLPKPPDKVLQKKVKNDFQNPVGLLRYVMERLGIEIKFVDEVIPMCSVPPHSVVPLPMRLLAYFCFKLITEVNLFDNYRTLLRSPFMPMLHDQFLVPPLRRVPFNRPCNPGTLCQLPSNIIPSPNAVIPPQRPFLHNFPNQSQPIHKVRLILNKGFPEFIGKGITKKRARNNAATQALSYVGPYLAALETQASNKINGLSAAKIENFEKDNVKSVVTIARNGKPKSSISQIHECALHMRMNVEFLVLKEEGPAHDKRYLLRCKLISSERVISADGEGSSKKIAKQNACSLMIDKLQSVESSPIFIATTMLKTQKKNGSSKEMKRKTIIKDMKMNPEYGHQINPISRLMQVMQARKQNEPKFQLISERGQSRYKEFVMEVICDGDLRCEGVGPNKKLAKRAAAEAVLEKIGYVKPMPKPGKSLLKKRHEKCAQNPEIGVFQPDDKSKSVLEADKEEDKEQSDPKVSEITLSVTASMGSQVMAFAGVDKMVHAGEQKDICSTSFSKSTNTDEEGCCNKMKLAAQPKRRVTFSNEVSSCPPPDDSSYPSASITPLKSEVVVVNKLRRKGRDSKKWLSEVEKKEIAEKSLDFFKIHEINIHSYDIMRGGSDGLMLIDDQMEQLSLSQNTSTKYSTAKCYLEAIAERYKFTVSYTDFPTTSNGMESQCFSLISVGIDQPIVCHGSGNTEQIAHEDAARNVLLLLCKI